MAGGDSVDVKRWPCPATFVSGVAFFAKQLFDADRLCEFAFVAGQLLPQLSFALVQFTNVVVEAGDLNAAVGIDDRRKHVAKCDCGIHDGSAKRTTVQVLAGPVDLQFVRRNATQSVSDRRLAIGVLARVADHHTITSQPIAQIWQHAFQVLATDFLFTFDQEFDLQRQWFAGCQPIADALHVGQRLAFVVGRAAGVQISITDGWFKRSGDPLVQGLNWLYVVVAVDDNNRGTIDGGCFRQNHRVSISGNQFNTKPGTFQFAGEPVASTLDVVGVSAVAADTGYGEPLNQLSQVSL